MNRMQFTMNRKNNFINSNISNNHHNNLENRIITSLPVPRNNITVSNDTNIIKKGRMLWGPPIWFLFHTLCEKVMDDKFLIVRKELINNILLICKNLPCPYCATHATEYMSKINFATIQTKEDLKILMFNFHNSVNQRKGVPLFTKTELDEKYKSANNVNIINNFILHFQNKHKSIRIIADDLYRQRLTTELKEWFLKNLQYFSA